jgi:phage-related protein
MSEFAWVPDFTFVTGSECKTEESEAECGVKQYRAIWPTPQRNWTLSFKSRTSAVVAAVLAFFEAKLGKATSFTWTCPLDGVEYTVRFKNDKISFEQEGYEQIDFDIELEQDIS